ncbi:MAG TPA: glycoside hydrolase family 57 protein [Candidatus Binatia bacterium]|nr:glycoside hydrolase family 57 protein [Candidatus Binatia bacterium]
MPDICFYFQVHQPYRLRRYSLFEVGRAHDYFDGEANAAIVRKVAARCYVPMNELLLDLVERHGGHFRVSMSLTGTVIEQMQQWAPEALAGFRRLVSTGCVELLAETDAHSLAFAADAGEFVRQVDIHAARIHDVFGARPRVFRNTELIFSNALARHLQERGFAGVLAEGADAVLAGRSPGFVYTAHGAPKLPVLLKSYRLSDDIAFRFGDRNWPEHPLAAARFAAWMHEAGGDLVNLFMDYETFGEHQWASTGIFEFMRELPARAFERGMGFVTPSMSLERCGAAGEIDVPRPVSWADAERDMTAWTGNAMQRAALDAVFALSRAVLDSGDETLVRDWRRLTTSDHFYYMCTKYFADGDVHAYFSPYESPYEAHINYMNVIADLRLRLSQGRSAARGRRRQQAVQKVAA